MKSIFHTFITAIECLVITGLIAYGFSGLYLLIKDDEGEAFIFGYLTMLIFVVAIPAILWISLVNYGGYNAVQFGADSLGYVLLLVFSWIGGIIIRTAK